VAVQAKQLARIVSGDLECLFQTWRLIRGQLSAQAHNNFDVVAWRVDHTRLLTQTLEMLKESGSRLRRALRLEFRLPRSGLVVRCNPDLVAEEDDLVTVIDCKTGKQQPSDQVQIWIYQIALSFVKPFAGRPSRGILVYSDCQVAAPSPPADLLEILEEFAEILSSPTPPSSAPGTSCRFCPLTSLDCPDRVELQVA
jgi:CRISPR/Cas system-associated exonuclease Cas4 (RecB family)